MRYGADALKGQEISAPHGAQRNVGSAECGVYGMAAAREF
ncbi:hypothetical protein Barb4_02564 [Bacteroidales bacterium Barb4]|nr:hypothetical protein Barb4_02564 [Bacteroidales bacterium Barb4]